MPRIALDLLLLGCAGCSAGPQPPRLTTDVSPGVWGRGARIQQ